jgi:hypothetical protein
MESTSVIAVLGTLGLALGSSWASGINLYAMVATLGLLGRFAGLELPGDLGIVTDWWVIGIASVLYVVEFAADKVPIVDSIWDVVHTFIRVPAGAVVAAAALGDFSPWVQVVAFLLGGGVALSSHGAKAATRVVANMSPEPASNITLSVVEDVVAVGGTLLAAFLPILMLGFVAIAVTAVIWLAPKVFRRLRGRRAATATP